MSDKLDAAQIIKDKDRVKIQKRLRQIEIVSKMGAAEEIEKSFDRLFDTLHLIDDSAKIEKRDIISVIKTYRYNEHHKGVQSKLLKADGDITEL